MSRSHAGGRVTGDVRVAGHPQERATFARVSGYVEQTDVHSPQATVKEALWFSARLRLPHSVHNRRMWNFIEEVRPFWQARTTSILLCYRMVSVQCAGSWNTCPCKLRGLFSRSSLLIL